MRKMICLLTTLLLCTSLILPAMAEESIFVPSKGPDVNSAVANGEDVKDCVVVTDVTEAKHNSTDIHQDERDVLVMLYEELSAGTMQLPVTGEFQYVELCDVSFALADCRNNADHEETIGMTVDFELDVPDDAAVIALVYINDKWMPVKSVTNNGNRSVTVVYEQIAPTLFLLPMGGASGSTTVSAPDSRFVPSITYKGGPSVLEATMGGEGVEECVVVTTIVQAVEKSTDITQDDRDLLLGVYEKLNDGSMQLPLAKNYVIRELIDLSFEHEDCRIIEEHEHKDQNLKKDGVTLTVVFDMDVSKGAEIIVMAYVDGKWDTIKSVENNGDGTITCVFEDICPVAFVVEDNSNSTNPKTSDMMGKNVSMWIGVMAFCLVGIVAMVAPKARKHK